MSDVVIISLTINTIDTDGVCALRGVEVGDGFLFVVIVHAISDIAHVIDTAVIIIVVHVATIG